MDARIVTAFHWSNQKKGATWQSDYLRIEHVGCNGRLKRDLFFSDGQQKQLTVADSSEGGAQVGGDGVTIYEGVGVVEKEVLMADGNDVIVEGTRIDGTWPAVG